MSWQRLVAIIAGPAILQIGCVGAPRQSIPALPSSPHVTIGLTVRGVDNVCYAQIFREAHGCVYSSGKVTPPPLSQQDRDADGDGGVLRQYAIADGRSRVLCGEVGVVCGVGIYCSCGDDAIR